jgi:hypothetical protein
MVCQQVVIWSDQVGRCYLVCQQVEAVISCVHGAWCLQESAMVLAGVGFASRAAAVSVKL